MSKRAIRVALWALAVAQMVFIYSLSAQDASTSSQTSGRVAQTVAKVLTPGFDQLPEARRAELVAEYQHGTRKAAHVAEYALLCALMTLALGNKNRYGAPIALLIAIGYAALDEFHQLSVEGRGAQFTDVLIDTGGAALGMGAALLLFYWVRRAGSRR